MSNVNLNDIKNSFKQSNFSRSLYNEAKLGAYYTDVGHCKRIGRLFSFPDDEVCVLEPSIGDGKAVISVTENCSNRKIFGVELNKNTYDKIKSDEHFEYLLNEDFLKGIKVSHASFSFCFANPPYGVDQDGKERLEKLFIEKIYGYLAKDAILTLVIPYHVLTDEKVLRCFMARFNPLAVFKFDDNEYKKFKQIVVIGMKRRGLGFMNEWYKKFCSEIDSIEKLDYLPQLDEEVPDKIPVLPSYSDNIEYFTTLRFDYAKAAEGLKSSPLYKVIQEKAVTEEYTAAELGRPPVPLKKDSLYICAIAGGGQGIVGSEETHDLHLQRGVAKVEKENEIVPNGDQTEVIERSYTKVSLNIIQNDGTITTLS